MTTRFELYRAKSEQCKTAADRSDPAERDRWLKLSKQWADMTKETKSEGKKRRLATPTRRRKPTIELTWTQSVS